MKKRFLFVFLILFAQVLCVAESDAPVTEEQKIAEYYKKTYGREKIEKLSFDEVKSVLMSDEIYHGRMSERYILDQHGILSEHHPYSLVTQFMLIALANLSDAERHQLWHLMLYRNIASVDVPADTFQGFDICKPDDLFKKYFGICWAELFAQYVAVPALFGLTFGSFPLFINQVNNNPVMLNVKKYAVLGSAVGLVVAFFLVNSLELDAARFEKNIKFLQFLFNFLKGSLHKDIVECYQKFNDFLKENPYRTEDKIDKRAFKDALMSFMVFYDSLAEKAGIED
jgi:hypothetical protein